MGFSSPSLSAFAAALFLILAGVLSALTQGGVLVQPIDDEFVNETSYTSMEPEALEEVWRWRTDAFPLFLAVDALYTIAVLFLVHVAMALKNVHKGTPGLSPKIMYFSFVAGAVLPVFEFLQNLGSYGMADYITNWLEFPDSMFPAVEIAFLLSQARGIWIYSLQFIFLGTGFALTSLLTIRYHHLPTAHAIVGVVCAALSFLVFIFELVAFSDFRVFGTALAVTFGLYSLLVVPVWLVATGIALRKWVPKHYAANTRGQNTLRDSSSSGSEQLPEKGDARKKKSKKGRSSDNIRVELDSADEA